MFNSSTWSTKIGSCNRSNMASESGTLLRKAFRNADILFYFENNSYIKACQSILHYFRSFCGGKLCLPKSTNFIQLINGKCLYHGVLSTKRVSQLEERCYTHSRKHQVTCFDARSLYCFYVGRKT